MAAAPCTAWPPLSAATRLLVVAPHPDDETIAAGVLIQRVQAAGGTVCVLLLTDGDNNPWPQRWIERRWSIGVADRARWGRRRRAEFAVAMDCLGVPASAVRTLGWPDLGLLDALRRPGLPAVTELVAALDAFAPDLIALPALDDRHPDHGAAHVLMRLALQRRGGDAAVLEYLIHGRSHAVADVAWPATPRMQATKLAALAACRSQLTLSRGRLLRAAARPERFGRADRLAAERLPWRPSPLWRSRLHVLAVDGGSGLVQAWPWAQAPLRRDTHDHWWLDWPAQDGHGLRFVRIALDLATPWIFDRWGWCELCPCAAAPVR